MSRPTQQRIRTLAGGLLALAVALALPTSLGAGAFTFAGEANGVNIITHPTGYTGTGGTVTVKVCIKPGTANASVMEIPTQNLVTAWNDLIGQSGNLELPSSELGTNEYDWESVALHEVGHCLGLAHPNLASESGVGDPAANSTKASDGNGSGSDNETAEFDTDAGTDGLFGSSDDIRGDDVNLHWFRKSNNDPGTIDTTVDTTTYSRTLGDLPAGHSYPANLDRDVADALGHADTEAVMQQGQFNDEVQRNLSLDDEATIRLAMAGVDETQGTDDDYVLEVVYGGVSDAGDCAITLEFDGTKTGFAVCASSATGIATNHFTLLSNEVYFHPTVVDWYFNQTPRTADNCPGDPNKTEPGQCGCGVADTDTDGDGTADCNDGCVNDSNKIAPGQCGCGVADTDTDGDGTADCNDGCVNDSNKTAAGQCGCGVADTDSDGDGVADCNDVCPGGDDGVDGDGDGTPNDCDGCPSDPAKQAPGQCGCGAVDLDTDGDGVADCLDICPGGDDGDDADGDGTPDFCDLCPSDPNKTLPGACGCGASDDDVNGDTVPDCCVPGDVWPDGTGDDQVDLRDWANAVMKTVSGTVPIVSQDLNCGDVAPAQSTCLPATGPRRICADPDGTFDSLDADVIRKLAAGTDTLSCNACPSARDSTPAELRLVGDVAPRDTSGDGAVDISDVLLLLQWVVGNQSPPTVGQELFLRGDVSPTKLVDTLLEVVGDDALDISDVLALLRFVVGLDTLVWPKVEGQVNATGAPSDFIGFQVVVSDWDDFAATWTWNPESDACDTDGGLDVLDDVTVITCLGASTSGNQLLAGLDYRAPESSGSPTVEIKYIEADFDLVDGTASYSAD